MLHSQIAFSVIREEMLPTNELKRGVRDVDGLLKKPWCGTRYSSASTMSSMSSSYIRVR